MSNVLLGKLEDYVESIGEDIDLIATEEINCCDAREIEVLENVQFLLQRLILKEREDDAV